MIGGTIRPTIDPTDELPLRSLAEDPHDESSSTKTGRLNTLRSSYGIRRSREFPAINFRYFCPKLSFMSK